MDGVYRTARQALSKKNDGNHRLEEVQAGSMEANKSGIETDNSVVQIGIVACVRLDDSIW